MIKLISPQHGAFVSLRMEHQQKFLDSLAERKLSPSVTGRFSGSDKAYAKPEPVHFIWEDEERLPHTRYIVIVSEHEDMSSPMAEMVNDTHCDFYNLQMGKQYFWCIQKDGKRSAASSFTTKLEPPRYVTINFADNIRDCGGYTVPDGIIRQGLLYRGGTLDSEFHVTDLGAKQAKALGIKTDLDLRKMALELGKTQSILSHAGVEYKLCPVCEYKGFFDGELQNYSRMILSEILTDRSFYPVYFHCYAGADRTGTLAYVIGALMGMNDDDLINEYEITSISAIAGIRNVFDPRMAELLEYINTQGKGNTTQEKVLSLVTGVLGVTEEKIQDIADILIERR